MDEQAHGQQKWSADKTVILISLLYIVLPIIIFCYGWLKVILAIPISLIFIYFIYKSFVSITSEDVRMIKRDSIWFWIVTLMMAAIWVYLSGIGGMTYQNADFWARNPTYRDLCNYSWPMIFDLSEQPEHVQTIVGSTGTVAFSYYFSWWLLPASISKILGMGELGRNIALYIYSVVGILCVIYGLLRYFRKISYVIPLVFIFFSGLDLIGFWLKNATLPELGAHIEWWSLCFQLSSNTTLLFWVFNQAIPVWIITILMMQTNNANGIGMASLSFAYSPWATFGIVPIALGKCIEKDRKKAWKTFKEFFSAANILVSITMLIVYGLFYTCGIGGKGETGFILALFSPPIKILILLIAFLFLEVIIFYLIMGKAIVKKDCYVIVLAEFLIFPLFRVIHYNWLIRGLIPASFILMIYCIGFLLEKSKDKEFKLRKAILIAVLIIGSFTPLSEMVRTFKRGPILQESVYSFGKMQTTNEDIIKEIQDQHFKYDYTESAFFMYMAK